MSRNVITQYADDLLGTIVEDETLIKTDVPVVFDGQNVTLDLLPATYDALRALFVDKDADGVRTVFGAEDVSARRFSKEEADHIRAVAREAGMEVKDSGRLPLKVIRWFQTEYKEPVTETPETPETPDSKPRKRS